MIDAGLAKGLNKAGLAEPSAERLHVSFPWQRAAGVEVQAGGAWDRPQQNRLRHSKAERLVHRFLGTDHLRWFHVIHDDVYPGL